MRSTKDFNEEIKTHLALEAEELEEDGLSPEEAYRRARVNFGNVQVAEERFYLKSRVAWWDAMRADARFALRQLLKHRAFTLTAVLTLALGIGANTEVFTVIESVLLKALPYPGADRLVQVETRYTNTGHLTPRMTGADAMDVRAQARSLEAMSLYGGGTLGVQLRDHALYAEVALADAAFADVFRVQPVAGRWFTDGEAHRAVMVSEGFARDNFGGAQAALGQVLHIENEAVEIVGVLPGGFAFPGKTQVWEAMPLTPESKARTAFNYRAVARLRGDATVASAAAELASLSRRLEAAYPEDNRNKRIEVEGLAEALTGKARPTLLLLWATAAIILLIALVNVTHLQLVRAMERQREMAIRKALGSTRWQVVRPVLLESLMLALVGAAAGVLVALPAVRVLVNLAPKELPRASEIHLNGWVLGFALALGVATALLAAVIPALRAAEADPASSLKNDAARGMVKKGTGRLRDGLVVAEVTATFVLAAGAGLLLHTMRTLMTQQMGLNPEKLLVVDVDAPAHSLEDAERVGRQFSGLLGELQALPGVEKAAGIMGLPTGNYGSNGYYNVRGGLPVDEAHKPWAYFSVASPGYFETMQIPMQRGRGFTAQDTYESPFVAVISERLALESFGTVDAVGRQIQCGLDTDKWMTVVGVVGDVRQDSPAAKLQPTLYMPLEQHPFFANQIHLVLRTAVDPLTLTNAVRAKTLAANPAIAMQFTTMDTLVGESITTERFRAALLTAFAAAGLLLAMLGVYGTTAYTVAQRTFEIGLRMAFGADRAAIVKGILRHAARLAVVGIALGAGLSLLLGRLVTSMLVGVKPTDPWTLGGAAVLLLATALAAAAGPGWKATRVDPLKSLRAE